MTTTPTLTRRLSAKSEIIYQMICTDAVTLSCAEYPKAYSILILRAENDSVTESGIIYDVSRKRDVCESIMKRMVDMGILPSNAAELAEELL